MHHNRAWKYAFTRGMAALLASLAVVVHPHIAVGSPGDIFSSAAPVIGADPPKATDLKDGDASVSSQTGAFEMSIPIQVPPGRGIGPQLALRYSSQAATYGSLAAGWALSVPSITEDPRGSRLPTHYAPLEATQSDSRADDRFVSSMAGGRPLVVVDEPIGGDVYKAYRAQGDSSFSRYQRMSISSTYRWRVLTADGVTRYFGDTANAPACPLSDGFAPLTREVDAFGNEVAYRYVLSEGECMLTEITYGQNQGAGLASFASVTFSYHPAPICAGVRVGSQTSYRTDAKIVTGANKIFQITATAYDPGTSAVEHTREYTLGYDTAAESCNTTHAPLRLLTSIQESAWHANSPHVDLPATTFTYNSATTTLVNPSPGAVQSNPPWGGSRGDNLGWGYRNENNLWPSVEAIMVDLDGDGLVDRLMNDAPFGVNGECRAWWAKNMGENPTTGHISFGGIQQITLPRLKWSGGSQTVSGSPTPNTAGPWFERCSLNGQTTAYKNSHPPGSQTCHDNTACVASSDPTDPNLYCDDGTECPGGPATGSPFQTHLSYRWLDADGDGLTDLVAAVHGSIDYYDIERGNDVGYSGGEPSISGLPAAGYWPPCPAVGQQDRCKAFDTCLSGTMHCVGTDLCTTNWSQVATCAATQATTACSWLITPPSADPRRPYTRCEGLYPWFIYRNNGNGQISTTPTIKYQPVPLESESADSNVVGPMVASQNHAVLDFDGDGRLDALVKAANDGVPVGTSSAWQLWLGDGTGGFAPSRHVVPTRQHPYNTISGVGVPTTSGTRGEAGTVDLNGDGLVDHWLENASSGNANVSFMGGTGLRLVLEIGEVTTSATTSPRPTHPGADTIYDITEPPLPTLANARAGWTKMKSRLADVDGDGRPDVVQSDPVNNPGAPPVVFFNVGGQFIAPTTNVAFPGISTGVERKVQMTDTQAINDPLIWELVADQLDVDGNGISEAVYFGAQGEFVRAQELYIEPPRLLSRVENGRGAKTTIRYASMHEAGVVEQHPEQTWWDGRPKASPVTQWVVCEIEVEDSFAQTDGVSHYLYKNPRHAPDDTGRYGFRGFEEVSVTGPSGATTISRYGYNVDWSGRVAATLVVPAEAPVLGNSPGVHTIDRTTWDSRSLFNGALTTYHAVASEHILCGGGQTEAACTASLPSSATAYTKTVSTLTALANTAGDSPPLLWLETASRLQAGVSPANGDRVTSTESRVFAESDIYRVRAVAVERSEQQLGGLVMFGKTATGWDPAYRVPLTTEVWVDANDANRLISRNVYDMATGNVVEKWKPKQNAANTTRTVLTYDSRGLFVATTVNEVGHQIDTLYDYGTGALLEQKGPNERTCVTGTSGCPEDAAHPVKQTQRYAVDGLGRVLERWETISENSVVYTLYKLETNTYVDTPVGTTPASVLNQKLIDELGTTWTQKRTNVDGHGRPIKVTTYAQGSAPHDHITTFSYNAAGKLTSTSVPDPTANNASVVTYTYAFDSLGRPISARRPDSTGVDITYNGLSQTATEVVGTAGGQASQTVSTNDAFGRLTTVQEKTAAFTYATTSYAYGPHDLVTSILDPTNVVVEMEYDFAGHRTRIARPGDRSWIYTYDANGNLASERVPYDGEQNPVRDANYTSFFVYDDLDRITWKYIAPRDLSAADRQLFASDREKFTWDLSFKGQQRLWYLYAPTGQPVESFDMYHDAAGRPRITVQYLAASFTGLASTISRGVQYTFHGSGLPRTTRYFDFPTTNPYEVASRTYYDARGLPSSVRLVWPTAQAQDLAVYTRNVAGLVTKRTSPTGGSTNVESNWTYDALGRVVDQTVQQMPGATPVVRQQLAYFGNDDVSTLTHHLGATSRQFSFTYDLRHQLTDATATPTSYFASGYRYDQAGRLTHATVDQSIAPVPAGSEVRSRDVNYIYGGADPEQVTALANVSPVGTNYATYTYDATGNQLTRSYPATGELWEYLYDGKDQLRRVTKKLSGVIQGSEEYWYGLDGQRNIVVKRDASGAKSEVIWFHGPVEAHYDGTWTVTKVYSHVGLGAPVARIERPNSSSMSIEYQFHGLASNTIAAIAADGTINASFSYAPFGEVLEATNGGGAAAGKDAHMRRFNDKFEDDVSGLTYYGARYYDNLLTGWTQSDPIYLRQPDRKRANPRRANLSVFSLNNPLRYNDPDGREPYVLKDLIMPSQEEWLTIQAKFQEIMSKPQDRGTLKVTSVFGETETYETHETKAEAMRYIAGEFNIKLEATQSSVVSLGSGNYGNYNSEFDVLTLGPGAFTDPVFVVIALVHEHTHRERHYYSHPDETAEQGENAAYEASRVALERMYQSGLIGWSKYLKYSTFIDSEQERRRCPACTFQNPDLFHTMMRNTSRAYNVGLWGVEVNPKGPLKTVSSKMQ